MQELLYEERDRTVFLTLNRPRVRNCLSMKLSDELIEAIERVRASESLCFLVMNFWVDYPSIW
jgi:enoyl-CoA hydratase/carnithine racemase